MQIIKPNWVTHEDEKGHPQTIYSVHVHPDGTRIATGSIQNVVKLWSTKPILDQESESIGEDKVPRLLCTMEGHDGAVLCVRWTHSGNFLATGSDDSIIMVWLRQPGKSKSFGSKVPNIEDWKSYKRLAGHTSDVSGLAWSSDDQYLASIGLDNLVLIWDCQDSAFLLLRRLDLHQGHVNGVAWDPVGQFLATQSDDRTVKIWRTTDWKMEANITAPFVDAPMSFFRRLSWSPDGAHIVTPNSMNGPVFVSAVIERNQWTSDISLVGHENVVEVVAYNPQMFLKDKNAPPTGYNLCAALALGARNSISIWLTNSSTPLVVLHDVFDRDILDISWADDGVTLYACSSEGRVAAFVVQELRSIVTMAPPEAKAAFHKTYSFKKPERPRQSQSMSISNPSRNPSPLMPTDYHRPSPSPVPSSDFTSSNHPREQETTIMPNGKRRIRPVYLGANESSLLPQLQLNGHSTPSYSREKTPTYTSQHHRRMDAEFLGRNGPLPTRLPSFLMEDYDPPEGNDNGGIGELRRWETEDSWGDDMIPPTELNSTTGSGENELKLCCQNFDGTSTGSSPKVHVKLVAVSENLVVWENEILHRRITSIAVSFYYSVLGFLDGSLLVLSRSGRRILPVIALDSSCILAQLRNQFLMVITSRGTMNVWDLERCKTFGNPIKLQDLNPMKSFITFSGLSSKGLPLIGSKEGNLYTFDRDLSIWTVLIDPKESSSDLNNKNEKNDTDDEVTGSIEYFMKNKNNNNNNNNKLWFDDGSESSLNSVMVFSSSIKDLESCLRSYTLNLIDSRSIFKVEELCKDLWNGCFGVFGRESFKFSGRLEITRKDRLKLLNKTLDILKGSIEFRSIFEEYSILLKHSNS